MSITPPSITPVSIRPEQPELAGLLALWEARRSGRRMPARRDLDVLDLRPWMGRIILLDVLGGGADFFYRIHGTDLAERIGFDLTGRRLSSASERPMTAQAFAEYRRAVEAREPQFYAGSSYLDRPHIIYDKLVLPLADDGETVDRLLVAIYPGPGASDVA